MQITADMYRQRLAAFEQRAAEFRARGHLLPPQLAAQEASVLNQEQDTLRRMYAALQQATTPQAQQTVHVHQQTVNAPQPAEWNMPSFKPITWVLIIGVVLFGLGACTHVVAPSSGIGSGMGGIAVILFAGWVGWYLLKTYLWGRRTWNKLTDPDAYPPTYGHNAELDGIIAQARRDADLTAYNVGISQDLESALNDINAQTADYERSMKRRMSTMDDSNEVWG